MTYCAEVVFANLKSLKFSLTGLRVWRAKKGWIGFLEGLEQQGFQAWLDYMAEYGFPVLVYFHYRVPRKLKVDTSPFFHYCA